MSIKLLTCKWARLSFSNLRLKKCKIKHPAYYFLNEDKSILTKKLIFDKWKQKISRQDGVSAPSLFWNLQLIGQKGKDAILLQNDL